MAYLDETGLAYYNDKIKNWIEGPSSDVAHKTGDETIDGVKTFQNTGPGHNAGETVTDFIIRNPAIDRGTPAEGGRSYTRFIMADRAGDTESTFAGRLGLLEVVSPTDDDTFYGELRLGCYKYSDDPADATEDAVLSVGYDVNGIPIAKAPETSEDRTNSADIVTRGYLKDMLRANVEALTGGRNTVVRDQWGNPHVMVVIPKFRLSDINPSWASSVHPAFIVNGVEKSEILVGKYLASKSSANRVQTLPHQAPWTQVDFSSALSGCRALGSGFCLNTNAMWSARVLWAYKALGGSHESLGNRNYGRDWTYHELSGTMKNSSYLPGNTSLSDAATLTGTGGEKWNDDETAYGIADLTGNVWEMVAGFRLVDGEIQILPNNDAALSTADMSAASTEWKAILEDGSLVTPGTSGTLKFDSAYADTATFSNAGAPSINTSITNVISVGYNGADFKNLAAASGVTVPALLTQLAAFPIANSVQGRLLTKNSGECLLFRGGSFVNAAGSGPFALSCINDRSSSSVSVGFRTAFVS